MNRITAFCILCTSLATISSGIGAVTIDGKFGKVEVDTKSPALTQLILRTGEGNLDAQSILSPTDKPWLRGVPSWGTQAYTYVVDEAGTRYESRIVPSDGVKTTKASDGVSYAIDGVKLVSGKSEAPIAIENWNLSSNGNDLVWKVERKWLKDTVVRFDGSPAVFYSNRPWDPVTSSVLENCVASTIWYDPEYIEAWHEPAYRPFPSNYKLSLNNMQVITDPNAWAVFKLWTNWHNKSDLKLEVDGGYLYRRGFFGWIGEAGSIEKKEYPRQCRKGDVEVTTLRISWEDKEKTGYQLALSLPDKGMETTLKSFYSSLLNGGVVNDQKNYDFGNESDGWYYSGSTWMQGFALSAGVPASGKLSKKPFDVSSAFRRHLEQIFGTIMGDARSNFGYDPSGTFVDSLLNNIIGTKAYLLHSGDLPFVRQYLPTMEKMISYFIDRRNSLGLFDLGPSGHWYYDAMPTSGVNANHNALFYKALLDLAEMERSAGYGRKADKYESLGANVKDAFNKYLWYEDAPGGPRYCDWITPSGEKVTYCADVCQFPPVAVGIASPEQAKKLIATIDKRIEELKAQYGYTEIGSLSAYWPVPDHLNPLEWQRAFPVYMNCGSFLAQTYWEIMARIKAGDTAGALNRMKHFTDEAKKSSFMGNNWLQIDGKIGFGASDEPYLSDMIVVPAALVHGFLGVNPAWDKLDVNPKLPDGWTQAKADILYKGRIHHISVQNGEVMVTPGKQIIQPGENLSYEVRPANSPEWQLTTARHFATGADWKIDDGIDIHHGQYIGLKRTLEDNGLLGLWKMDEASGNIEDSSVYSFDMRVHGSEVKQGVEGHSERSKASLFNANGYMEAVDGSNLSFNVKDSVSLQCWFKTNAPDSRVMVSKPMAYCLYVKDGKLAAWIMQDGLVVRETLGSRNAADGKWHHALAVYDRNTQKLSLYLDGVLDTGDGLPSDTNPVDISPIGHSSSTSPLSIGGLGPGYPFIGFIDEVSIHRGALTPAESSYHADYPAIKPVDVKYHQSKSGKYISSPFFWGSPVQLSSLTVDAELSDGQIDAVVESSSDGFKTVMHSQTVKLKQGRKTYHLSSELKSICETRVRFELSAGKDSKSFPEVHNYKLSADLITD
ncbi:MAG: LamG-like jellyroll fold domain-containing protein [Armatimonadota bacterium]